MSFAKRMETLMDIYRISNATLARGLGVDASLISRWKTGNRLPPAQHVAHEIAAFLSGLPLRPRDQSFLAEVLESRDNDLAAAMEKYLLDIPNASPPGAAVCSEPDALLSGLCALLQRDGGAALRGPVSLWPRVQKGQPQEHEVFFGAAGKRQAAINVLYTVLSGSRQTELYMLLPDGVSWINGDPSFAALFYHALYVFTQRGGAITVIHNRPADTRELFAALSGFLPHYLTGRVFSYNLAGPCRPPAPTLLVARGLCATNTLWGDPQEEVTVLYQGAADAKRHEKLFKEYLADANPLAQACDMANPMSMPAMLAELERRPGDCRVATRALNPMWAPEPLLQEYACREPSAMPLLARRRDAFVSQPARWVEVWPEELLLGIERKGQAALALGPFCGQAEILLSGEELKMYLNGLLTALRHDKLQIFQSSQLLNVGYLAYKAHAGALLAPETAEKPAALLLSGEDALSLLDSWYTARLSAASQDKRQMIARVETVLRRLGTAAVTA